MCGTNGGQDQLVECPKDSFNWNSPYLSGRFQFPDEAMDLCGDNGSVDGFASPNIAWDYENFTRPEGRSAILKGTVYSPSDLNVAFLFKNDDSFPLRKMKCRFLASDDIWLVEWKLENLTLENGGFYSILAVNKQTSAWSRKTRLTVLPIELTTQQTGESSTKTATESQNTTRSLQSPTPVSTSRNSTEKPGGVEDGYMYYTLILIPVLIVVVLSMKGYYYNLERGNNEEERENDEKSDVEDELINSPEEGQEDLLQTTV
ncbi:uncharacterized protein LOC110452832 isoform X1 [Mizuhopecten yessoensis]|uniref:uncharacterized protein LOC110452832 isoform X1 n=1 Tax=Mizuhopecten yessoensis TaxID=6573 RepID=UPI000B45ADEA|nr:uncharacterized protein LOC110452832 isoform X1 [Mizuhopecten yessoensis]XP_021357202.1 uncharacterized protein LOC110452832 isoform X1 [Mizuhopecten yessoensis]